jgi:hypothetical protein
VSANCLKQQINFVLIKIEVGNTYPGTDGLPCDLLLKTVVPPTFIASNGDWDMRMKTLIRILYLDRGRRVPILAPSVHDHIQYDLIIVDGEPSPDGYSWTACGDNDRETGSPQDREDANSSEGDFLDSVGDFFSWLLKRLFLFSVFLGAAGVIALVPGALGAGGSLLVALGLAVILASQIPETENHRLMIESTRFLNNQLIIQDLGADNVPKTSGDQSDVRNWLLNRFHQIAQDDFIEFNARPYHGIALEALRNLADFSADADVRNGAQMLIEYSASKFAVGSNQGRRLVPFRRHFAAVDCIDGKPCPDLGAGFANNAKPAEIFNDFVQLGDSGVSLGLLFNGQTQQLPFGNASVGAAGDALPAATSHFIPNPLIADLAIRKDVLYFQRIHHAGYEAYSSGPSALITGGGVETDHAYGISGPDYPKNLVAFDF